MRPEVLFLVAGRLAERVLSFGAEFERFRLFPGEALAAKVTKRRRLAVDWTVKLQIAHDDARTKVEVVLDHLLDHVV